MARIAHYKGGAQTGASKKVFIATPTYSGKLDADYLYSLLYTVDKLRSHSVEFEHYVMSHNCHVDDSRNGILRDFLLSKCDELVFIDADVAWEPDALVKLIKHDRDVVAGVYPKRTLDDEQWPVRVGEGVTLQADKDGLVEVLGAPTGFMKIKRHVLEKLWSKNTNRQFYGQGDGPGDDPYRIVFERAYEDGHRMSGDYNFCHQWRKMGGKIYVDPELYLTHIGEVPFSGTLGHYWKRKHGVLALEKEANFKKAVDQLKTGEVTGKTWLDLARGWGNPFAADIELLASCYELAKRAEGPILETGTGLTTLVMAIANPKVQIHCLEHDPIWGSATKYRIDCFDIKNVTIHCHPLRDYDKGKWYDRTDLTTESFSLALCDGPPRRISNRSIFYDQMGDQIKNAVVVMDDADDEAAVKPFKDWAKTLGREVTVLGKRRYFAVSNKRKENVSETKIS